MCAALQPLKVAVENGPRRVIALQEPGGRNLREMQFEFIPEQNDMNAFERNQNGVCKLIPR